MSDHHALPPAIDAELDDVLDLLPLVEVMPDLADRVFDRLTDALVEAVLHDVRARHEAGEIPRSRYLTEVCRLVVALEHRGLLDVGRSGPAWP